MYKWIYDSFKHWYHGGAIYLYSDPHFGDEEMKYIRKNYIDDDEQVARINSVVQKNDTLIILGDIGDPSYVKRIKGYKILVKGNHDVGNSKYKDYFNEIFEGPVFIAPKILLSHEPIDFFFGINLHGHDHSLWIEPDDHHINLCAEHIDYKPVSLKSIVLSGALNKIDDIHRVAIERQKAIKDLE